MYVQRVADDELRLRLASAGAVVIEGPKACGKTETAMQVAGSSVLLDVDDAMRAALDVAPELVLEGPRPRLLDEWQTAPKLWNHVRRAVDAAGEPGQFILTGSATPNDDVARHSGAGRFSFLRMRPMSFAESGWSDASVSLAHLLAGRTPRATGPERSIHELAAALVVGGWPAQNANDATIAGRAARDYLTQVCEVDIRQVDGTRRDPALVRRVVRSLARNVATEARNSVLAADAGGADGPLSEHTVADYLRALDRLMVIEDQPAWAPHLRSKAVLRSSPKRHFTDASLAIAALGVGPEPLVRDLELLGQLVESTVVRDLRVLAQPLDGTVHHYRDNYGVECDAIVQLADGTWGAFEVKLGAGQIDDAAASLLRFADQIDTSRMGPPTVLAVVCALAPLAYRRTDGVVVVPLSMLGP